MWPKHIALYLKNLLHFSYSTEETSWGIASNLDMILCLQCNFKIYLWLRYVDLLLWNSYNKGQSLSQIHGNVRRSLLISALTYQEARSENQVNWPHSPRVSRWCSNTLIYWFYPSLNFQPISSQHFVDACIWHSRFLWQLDIDTEHTTWTSIMRETTVKEESCISRQRICQDSIHLEIHYLTLYTLHWLQKRTVHAPCLTNFWQIWSSNSRS